MGGLLPLEPVPYATSVKQHFDIPVITADLIITGSLANPIFEDKLTDLIVFGPPSFDQYGV